MNELGSAYRLDGTPTPDTAAPAEAVSSDMSTIVGYLTSFAMTAIATAIAVGVDSQVTIPNLSLLFVVPVVVAAVSFGLGPSVCSAILGSLAYNFFLTEPRYSLAVEDPANIWAIALLFTVGLIVSTVAFTSRRRALDTALLRRQLTVLDNFGRDLVAARNPEAIVSITSHALAALFQVPAVLVIVADGTIVSRKQIGGVELSEAELETALSSLTSRTAVRAGIYPDATSRFDFWPVAPAMGPDAIIGLAFDPDDRPAAPEELVNVVGSVLTLVLERQYSRTGSRLDN
jgi:two-component system sensor histidine kinase KdpD